MVLRRSSLGWLVDKIALFARKPHYLAHLQPIWDLIPAELKWTEPAWEQHGEPTLLVAGASDVRHGRPYIYVEHGSGQSYDVDNASYSGGSGHDACRLFLCPNEEVAGRWSARYPDTPVAVVGCPKLDVYHTGYTPPERTVAITFHWDCQLVPETRSAWPHYKDDLYKAVLAWRHQGWNVLGHSHPRYTSVLKPYWESLHVEWTDDPLRDASVLVADNTSMMAEFLSCGRPVVALNAPWYRRDVQHGHRFWDLDVTYAETALEASRINLNRLPAPTRHPYEFADGRAAHRASQAISSLLQ